MFAQGIKCKNSTTNKNQTSHGKRFKTKIAFVPLVNAEWKQNQNAKQHWNRQNFVAELKQLRTWILDRQNVHKYKVREYDRAQGRNCFIKLLMVQIWGGVFVHKINVKKIRTFIRIYNSLQAASNTYSV